MLRLNLASSHEMTYQLLNSLPAVLRLKVNYIHSWPEEVIGKPVA